MTAPDRIDEDPVLEEQQATSRGGDSPVGKLSAPPNKPTLIMVTEKVKVTEAPKEDKKTPKKAKK